MGPSFVQDFVNVSFGVPVVMIKLMIGDERAGYCSYYARPSRPTQATGLPCRKAIEELAW
jgi:hypothetical protein